ncbi:hypothetical protein CH373_00935 [Leptospira perolatii]|uniref:Uncharacterized protein n=1 Tax=Leptospira perolatii TaxID=2023191 RepID=A0A2M9ZRQ4_9LEPT|nr:hypothetical protein [Leptospira perolatii]PJZ71117.1 hypothetical protein CH360_00935 [Leptospira perolatii]PJZ74649.1 hypothetical protein CH373_00935 [Leptospira perolatii]
MNVGAPHNASLDMYRDRSVHYIGHGQLESSTESSSILHVISHELGHVAEFKNEAARDNADVRSIDVSIHYEMRNGKLVAVSGETKAVTVKKENQTKQTDLEKNDAPSSAQRERVESNSASVNKQNRSNTLSEKEWEILSELRRLDLELNHIYKASKTDDSENSADEDFHKQALLIEKKRKLEMELSQEKLKLLMKETLESLKKLSEKQLKIADLMHSPEDLHTVGNLIEAFA